MEKQSATLFKEILLGKLHKVATKGQGKMSSLAYVKQLNEMGFFYQFGVFLVSFSGKVLEPFLSFLYLRAI